MNDMSAMQIAATNPSNPTKEHTAPDRGAHSLTAVDRGEITVKGVSDVISFDESLVRLVTLCGVLLLEGEGMRVRVLDLKSGVVAVTGTLNGVLYEAETVQEMPARDRPRARRLFR